MKPDLSNFVKISSGPMNKCQVIIQSEERQLLLIDQPIKRQLIIEIAFLWLEFCTFCYFRVPLNLSLSTCTQPEQNRNDLA